MRTLLLDHILARLVSLNLKSKKKQTCVSHLESRSEARSTAHSRRHVDLLFLLDRPFLSTLPSRTTLPRKLRV